MEIKAMEKMSDHEHNQQINQRITELERLTSEYEQQMNNMVLKIREAEEMVAERDGVIKENEERFDQMAYDLAELKEQLIEKDNVVKELEVSAVTFNSVIYLIILLTLKITNIRIKEE